MDAPRTSTGVIDPRYGDATAEPPPWEAVERLLTEAQLYWIVTVRADGRPHAVPLVGVWRDGSFAFCTGAEEQKHRNLRGNPHVAMTTGATGADGWRTGKDVVVEGTAVHVTDAEDLGELAAAWYAKYGDDWHFEVDGEEFVEAGPDLSARGRARVFRVLPTKAIVFGDEHGQTTYRF
ncbi:pyridoxamine 5'-phosphate oxidase family protein [Actinotalea ferrariae]|uniref:pyridoxamine 5'-phosphate oxidase family protein n=1 Tax=Actinotalea ferrariae TaxID=1386098 RepID=UPI001C8B3D6F|nr:pyridoxamine 5'-phosphate oxidase family protein [Actinotalea ferrariae]MBX9245531.1 pyridoxamine 5'-phosphate oxidase family protein [Actinotalea ferrariae]